MILKSVRAVNRTAGTWTEDTGNLRNNPGSQDITLEDFCITGQGVDTFLDTCATRVVQTDNGSTHLHGLIHYFTDLHGQCFG